MVYWLWESDLAGGSGLLVMGEWPNKGEWPFGSVVYWLWESDLAWESGLVG